MYLSLSLYIYIYTQSYIYIYIYTHMYTHVASSLRNRARPLAGQGLGRQRHINGVVSKNKRYEHFNVPGSRPKKTLKFRKSTVVGQRSGSAAPLAIVAIRSVIRVSQRHINGVVSKNKV